MLLLSLMAILLWFIYVAIAHGIANVFMLQVDNEIKQWTDGKKVTKDIWFLTHKKLNWALKFDPYNPDLLERMGVIYYWRANISITLPEIFIAHKKALSYYFQVVKMKRTSAMAYVNIALMKYLLEQYDTQFQIALKQATVLSPWEPFIQRIVVEIGLSAWQHLSITNQMIVFATIKRGIKSGQTIQMSAIIKKYQRELIICTKSSIFFEFCQ